MTQISLNGTGVASAGALSLQSNGTTEAIGISTGQVATLAQNPILTSGTANGVAYLNGSKVLTTGSALVFDGTNLGVGVTPSAWGAGQRAIQSGNFTASGGGNGFTSNGYYNAGWKYVANGYATNIYEQSGAIKFDIAASGTAGNAISFTQAMTLDASGNFLVGTTSQIGGSRISFAQPNSSTDMKIGVSVATGTNAAYQVFVNNTVTTIGTENSSGGSLASGTGAYSTVISNSGAYPLAFGTNNTERARIDSSGNFLVGTTTLNGSGGTTISATNGGQPYILFNATQTTSEPLTFRYNGTTVGKVTQTTSATSYVTSSDYRLKEDVAPMTGALAKVALLNPVTYTWKIDGSEGQGFIAHELQAVVPDAVVGEKDAVDAEGNPEYQGIDTSFLVATLTAAIQEQQAMIAQQSLAIESLTARITALEA